LQYAPVSPIGFLDLEIVQKNVGFKLVGSRNEFASWRHLHKRN
jgi:hypothetical protein